MTLKTDSWQAISLLHPVDEIILYTWFDRLYKHLRAKCYISETERSYVELLVVTADKQHLVISTG